MTKTGDLINEQTQKAAQEAIGKAYLARRRKFQEVMADTPGFVPKEIPEVADPKDCYDASEVLVFNLPFAEEELPVLPVLVALGRDNLKGLLEVQRELFGDLADEQRNLNVIRGGLAQNHYVNKAECYVEEDLLCTGEDSYWEDVFGTACESCPKRAKFHANCNRAAMYRGKSDSQRQRLFAQAKQSDPAGKPCFVFQEGAENDALREQFLAGLRLASGNLEKRRKGVVQYIRNILVAKREPNLQIDLPMFSCLRMKRGYLVDGEIFCLYVDDEERVGIEPGFVWCKVVNDELHPLPNFVTQDETGTKLVKTFSELKQEFSAIKIDSKEIFYTTLDAVDINSPMILKPWEIMTLRNNPEYARMWVYSNFIEPHRGEAEAEKYLRVILGRN